MTNKFLYSVVRFVPDPARGEFVNIAAVVGSDETADWDFRSVDNLMRARQLDSANILSSAVSFIDQTVRARVEAFRDLLESAGSFSAQHSVELDQTWLERLHEDCQNVVQFSAPAPLIAESAARAMEMVFDELLVDPQARRFDFKKKTTALAAVRRAYHEHGLQRGRDYFERMVVSGAHHSGSFDFVVANGTVRQLTQAWSFQVPDQDTLAEVVKAWAWTVGDIRENGHASVATDRGPIDVPRDVDVAVAFIPPKDGQESPALDEAKSIFDKLNITAREVNSAEQFATQLAIPA